MNTAAHLPIGPMGPGTDESCWQRFLADTPFWSPPDGPLLIVSPHPDNAVLAAGGLIHTWAQLGRRVTILSLTDGEAAYPQWRRLAQVRREELRDALQVLSANPVLTVRLRIADSHVAENLCKLRGAIGSLLAPDTTLIAPYEHDGHPDHEAAGRACREMAAALSLPAAHYPIWAWHHADPGSMAGLWRRFPLSEAAQAAKAEAMNCFASQMTPYRRAPLYPEHIIRYFTRPYEAFLP